MCMKASTLTNFRSTDSDLILAQSILPELYGWTQDRSVTQLSFFLSFLSLFLYFSLSIYIQAIGRVNLKRKK